MNYKSPIGVNCQQSYVSYEGEKILEGSTKIQQKDLAQHVEKTNRYLNTIAHTISEFSFIVYNQTDM